MWESVAQARPGPAAAGWGGAGGCGGAVELSFLALGPQMGVGLSGCWG